MSTPLDRAIAAVGGQSKLARAIGVKPPTIQQWVKRMRPIPAIRCVAIEQVTNGAVNRRELRPNDHDLLWPEDVV